MKSQQKKKAVVAAQEADAGGAASDEDDDNDEATNIDPLSLIDPVDILSKLPKDFYDKLEDKKWQIRKESLECLEALLANPKLQSGDYHELIKNLKKILSKDSNVVLVAMAGKCIAGLARGLGKVFLPFAPLCFSAILEKFKEKKANVVTALREAADAIYAHWTFEPMLEDLLEALNNKNPSVKSETTQFLARSFAKTQPAVFTKKLLKPLTLALLKTLSESDPAVRDGSAEALGTLAKLLGDKVISPYLVDVDALKLAKIKEYTDKAEITVKIPTAPKKVARPVTAPAAAVATASKAVKRPTTGAATGAIKKNPIKKSGSASNVPASSSSSKVVAQQHLERELSPEEVELRAADVLPSNVLAELEDSNWKTRLAAVETINGAIDAMDTGVDQSQVLIRVLCKKPGLKDTNFQVIKAKLEAILKVIKMFSLTSVTGDAICSDVVEKLGDAKNSEAAGKDLSWL